MSIIKNDSASIQTRILETNLVASVMSLVVTMFWILLRSGFHDALTAKLFIALGMSLLFINANAAITIKHFTKHYLWFRSESFVVVALLAFAALLGYLPFLLTSTLSIIGALTGFAVFFFNINKLIVLTRGNRKALWMQVYFTLLFSIFVTGIIWSFYLNPLFLEMLSMISEDGINKYYMGDSLYHMSVAQMISNYHLPSSGVDGTPFLHYHFGSHWLFGQFSKLIGIHVVESYTLLYPLLFVPLIFKSIFMLVGDIQFVTGKEPAITVIAWVFLFCVFLKIPNHKYAGGYNESYMLVSESQAISFFLLFSTVSTCLLFFKALKEKTMRNTEQWIFMILVLPLLFCGIGLVKISSLFVLCVVSGYVFLRQRLFSLPFIIGGVLLAFASLCSYWITAETFPGLRENSGEGMINFFAFYKGEVLFDENVYNPFDWFFMFLLWAYLFIVLHFVVFRKRGKSSITVELLIATVIAGLLPSVFFQFFGANNVFFAAIQLYVSCILLMAYGDEIWAWIISVVNNRILKTIGIIFIGVLILFIHRRVAAGFKAMMKRNTEIRTYFYGHPGNAVKPPKLASFDFDYTVTLNEHPFYRYLSTCKDLASADPALRGQALVYIDSRQMPRMGSCIEKTFLVPALTGFARIEGMPYDCHINNYGDHQYEWNYETPSPDPEHFTDEELCNKVHAKGYLNLIRYNPASKTFEEIECHQSPNAKQ